MQILNYKNSLEHDYFSLRAIEDNGFESFDPTCVVIIGNASDELKTPALRKSFELLRAQHRGVIVITFDELFGKTQQLIDVLEASDGVTVAQQPVDDDMPF
jgi:antiviral defense system Shedu protein SduA